MYLSCEGERLYALLREPFGPGLGSGVTVMDILPDGALAEASAPLPTGGQVSAHLSVSQARIYTANYISGDISLLPGRIVRHSGHGADPTKQSSPHPHYIGFTPDGDCLAVADLGLDKIFLYDKELRPLSSCALPAGSGPRHLAFSPDGELAYCANELSSTVTVLRCAPGRLAPLETYEALPPDYAGASTAAAIRCTEDSVYVSHRGYDRVTRFSRQGEALVKGEDIPCCGEGPRDFELCGDLLICANERSDSAVVLRREGKSRWRQCCRVTLPAPLCVLIP